MKVFVEGISLCSFNHFLWMMLSIVPSPHTALLQALFPKFTEAELSRSQDWGKAESSKTAFLWCILYNVYFCISQQQISVSYALSEIHCEHKAFFWKPTFFSNTSLSVQQKTIFQLNCFLLWGYFSSFASNLNSNSAHQCLSYSCLYLPNTNLINTVYSVILSVIQNTEHDLEGYPFHSVHSCASISQEPLLNHLSQDCLWYFQKKGR